MHPAERPPTDGADSAQMRCTTVEFSKVITFEVIHIVLLSVNPIAVDPGGIPGNFENNQFQNQIVKSGDQPLESKRTVRMNFHYVELIFTFRRNFSRVIF